MFQIRRTKVVARNSHLRVELAIDRCALGSARLDRASRHRADNTADDCTCGRPGRPSDRTHGGACERASHAALCFMLMAAR